MTKSVFCWFAFIPALLGCSSVSSKPTLCELASNRDAYENQTVTVEGTLLVSKHGSSVEDASCDNGIPVHWTEDSQALREIAEIVEGGIVERHTIKVRMTGQLKLIQGTGLSSEPYWRLEVTSGHLTQ